MTVKPNKMMLTRILAVMLVLIIALSVVSTGSLVNIMIIKGEKYQKDASEQQLYDSLVTAPRGDIYDRNMQKLATSSPAWTVYITPNGIKSLKKESDAEAVRKKIAEGLSEILEMDYNTVYDYTGKKSYYVIVKKKVEKTVADKVRQFILDNKDLELSQYIGLDSTTKRYYPNGNLASVVLGFVGSDDQGLSGLESYYDNELTGTAGRVVAAKNAMGTNMPFSYEKVENAVKGGSLVLTLDNYVQYTADKYLESAIEEYQIAERGAAVVMNVNTGAILAMSVKGDFDPNEPFTLSSADQKKVSETADEGAVLLSAPRNLQLLYSSLHVEPDGSPAALLLTEECSRAVCAVQLLPPFVWEDPLPAMQRWRGSHTTATKRQVTARRPLCRQYRIPATLRL